MTAVQNEVNAAGGICGRQLDLVLKDDGWEAERGFQFIRNLVEGEEVFALAVVPSSEGLRVASTQRYLRDRGVPVVGTDGMLISQYTDPVVWPVAASTITAMHVMAKEAADRGRTKFGIVYDSNFRFGVEGAFAFNEAVKRITGQDVPGYSDPLSAPRCRERFCGIKAGQPSYQTDLQVFRSACQGSCDYVMYLLEPQTAQTWMEGGGLQAKEGIDVAGPQPLFNRSFASTCGAKCHNMWVWTGFLPPIGPLRNNPAVARYLSDVGQTNAQTDVENSFVVGGYIGMKLLVQALQDVGPDLTRARLIEALDAVTLDTGLSKPLTFRAGNHFANQCMMAYSIQSRPSFAGFRQETDFICDPWPGEDIPASER
jgi:ABC-type branched-subunit amino acid transport system substrate-binding protein